MAAVAPPGAVLARAARLRGPRSLHPLGGAGPSGPDLSARAHATHGPAGPTTACAATRPRRQRLPARDRPPTVDVGCGGVAGPGGGAARPRYAPQGVAPRHLGLQPAGSTGGNSPPSL